MNAYPFKLRAGDVILFEQQPCEVLRVNDCAAVIAVTRPAREFTTLFGKQVRFQPKPRLVRISPNSEAAVLRLASLNSQPSTLNHL